MKEEYAGLRDGKYLDSFMTLYMIFDDAVVRRFKTGQSKLSNAEVDPNYNWIVKMAVTGKGRQRVFF